MLLFAFADSARIEQFRLSEWASSSAGAGFFSVDASIFDRGKVTDNLRGVCAEQDHGVRVPVYSACSGAIVILAQFAVQTTDVGGFRHAFAFAVKMQRS